MMEREDAHSWRRVDYACDRMREALKGSEKLRASLDSQEILGFLFEGSDALSAALTSRPESLDWLVENDRLLSRQNIDRSRAHVDGLIERYPSDARAALRIFRTRELARICARELSGRDSLEEALRDWSDIADLAIDRAMRIAISQIRHRYGALYHPDGTEGRIATLGMGKLGARELNISSDVDLIYVHSSDEGRSEGGVDGSVEAHKYFVSIAKLHASLLNDITELGFCLRVDADLRPEGPAGELSNSIGAMETYYQSWGQTWERQAYIKARHIAGSEEVAREILDRLAPFVYRKYFDTEAIREIATIKDKIDIKIRSGIGSAKAKRNIKLGAGGIREIEFIIQSIQILWGGRYREARERSTLGAIKKIEALGLMSRPHLRDLEEAYILFRRIENRIQYRHLAHTHHIPADEAELKILTRLMGFDSIDQFQARVQKYRDRVQSIFDLFFRPSKEEDYDKFPELVERGEEEQVSAWLDMMKFDAPLESARRLIDLRVGKRHSLPSEKSVTKFDLFGPRLIAEASATPWPDKVLIGMERLLEKSSRGALYDLLASNPGVLKLLAELFARADALSNILIGAPDMLDSLIYLDTLENAADPDRARESIEEILASGESSAIKLERLNLLKATEEIRLGLARILNMIDRLETMSGLTHLAENYLRGAIGVAAEEARIDLEEIPSAIFALGKLGRREMNFGSDLDLILFRPDNEKDESIARRAKLFQNLARMGKSITRHGTGFEIDFRLRPHGQSAPLAITLEAAGNYYSPAGAAAMWERLALVGARSIGRDGDLSAQAESLIERFLFDQTLRRAEYLAVQEMRERIAREKVKPNTIDIKFGRGGMVEIEFIAQLTILERGAPIQSDQRDQPLTLAAIDIAELDRGQKRTLKEGYNALRSIEDALRIDQVASVNSIPTKGAEYLRLVRKVDAPGIGPERFLDFLAEIRSSVQRLYERFISERTENSPDS